MLTQSREPGLQFQLQDILAVMVGYGMAALLFRAFWPDSRPTPVVGVPAIGLYLWLGMAMSGPVILLQRRSRLSHSPVPPHQLAPSRSYTWAELAWLLIGTYWIVVGLFVIPATARVQAGRHDLVRPGTNRGRAGISNSWSKAGEGG